MARQFCWHTHVVLLLRGPAQTKEESGLSPKFDGQRFESRTDIRNLEITDTLTPFGLWVIGRDSQTVVSGQSLEEAMAES